ncbi:MAG TPA: LLM class flavin-dependent oxidoreductase [Pseudonocardiaceae bacterium]
MPDLGHDLLFGSFLPPAAATADEALRLAALTESLGLDLVGVQDHPYRGDFLDAWTLLSVIAARTERVRVFPDVANLPLRPPAVLARAAATLDILSGGRVELGLGAGGFWDAISAMDGPRRTPGESLDALEEAITVLRALWTPGRGVRFEGTYHRLAGVRPGPEPPHRIGIWVGGYGPRMLRLIGRLADGWLPSSPYLPPERLAETGRIIDQAAEDAGRAPSDIRRLYNIAPSGSFLTGSPAARAERLAELALTHGTSGFVLMADDEDELRRFAAEVVPAVRATVAAERGTP